MYEIKFYRTHEPYGCFSNFYKYPITVNGITWMTSEHYFQAQKFAGTIHEEEIWQASSAMRAAKMGRDPNRPLRKDWEKVKDSIMCSTVLEKVRQHKDIREILLSTGDSLLIEHTTNDSYWGDNGDGTGKNMLGRILMDIREGLPGYTGVFYVPQWIAYPGIHPLDSFWRRREGEGYILELDEWFYSLTDVAQREYRRYFVPPKEWDEHKGDCCREATWWISDEE